MNSPQFLLWNGPDERGGYRSITETAELFGVDVEQCLVVSPAFSRSHRPPTMSALFAKEPLGFAEEPSKRAAAGGWLRRLLGRQAPRICRAAAVLCAVAATFSLWAFFCPTRKES